MRARESKPSSSHCPLLTMPLPPPLSLPPISLVHSLFFSSSSSSYFFLLLLHHFVFFIRLPPAPLSLHPSSSLSSIAFPSFLLFPLLFLPPPLCLSLLLLCLRNTGTYQCTMSWYQLVQDWSGQWPVWVWYTIRQSSVKSAYVLSLSWLGHTESRNFLNTQTKVLLP